AIEPGIDRCGPIGHPHDLGVVRLAGDHEFGPADIRCIKPACAHEFLLMPLCYAGLAGVRPCARKLAEQSAVHTGRCIPYRRWARSAERFRCLSIAMADIATTALADTGTCPSPQHPISPQLHPAPYKRGSSLDTQVGGTRAPLMRHDWIPACAGMTA